MQVIPDTELLVRHLSGAQPSQLRAVAQLLLPRVGLRLVLRDGPYDGGVDFRLRSPSGDEDPRRVVACSVEADWRKKVREDAEKVLRLPEVDQLIFVSSRRIPELGFLELAAELADRGLGVIRVDAQALAGLAVEHGAWPAVLGLLGLPVDAPGAEPGPVDPRREWAYALAFLHPEAAALRREAQQLALCVVLGRQPSPLPVAAAAGPVAELLGVPLPAAELEGLARDLAAEGQLVGSPGGWSLSPGAADRLAAVGRARRAEADELARLVQEALRARGVQTAPAAWRALEPLLGRLLLPENLLATLRPAAVLPPLRDALALLEARGWRREAGLPALVQLLQTAAAHPFAQALRYGALARALHRLPAEGLSAALGADGPLRVVLDASVLMHLLCVWLHGDGPTVWDRAAARLRDLARTRGLSLAVPRVWLEEAAAHLIDALDYVPVERAGSLRELRGSQNAYVAAFAARGPSAEVPDLRAFLDAFAPVSRAQGPFETRRRQVERALADRVRRSYSCVVIDTPAAEVDRWDARLDRDRRFPTSERPRITVDHDVQVIAWLHTAAEAAGVVVLTWDNEVLDLCPEGRALDPVSFCDLAVALSPGPQPPLEGLGWAVELAMAPETDARAAFWDALVAAAGDRLQDAAFFSRAAALREDLSRATEAEARAAARAFAMDA
jgi:hypothetical protein